MRRWQGFGLVVVATVVLAVAVPPAAPAEDAPVQEAESAAAALGDKTELAAGDRALEKVSTSLLAARRLAGDGVGVGAIAERFRSLTFDGDRVRVDVSVDGLEDRVLSQLRSAGMTVVGAYPRYERVAGWTRLDGLDTVAAVDAVRWVRPEYGFTTNAGSVANQADVSINADDARAAFGVDGSGVQVGVLSDSFRSTLGGSVSGSGCNRTVTGMANQVSGDLPPSVRLLDNGSGSDEGAAMAELIHDLAPGADLAFHTANGGEAAFASGIDDLVACGADVIVDDIIYFAEPMFQDGVIAAAAQNAVDAGVPFFSSAGNQSTYGVDDVFDDFGDGYHDFGGGDRFAAITVPNNVGVRLVMQWNEPFDTPLTDYDVFLFDAASTAANVLAQGFDAQGCSTPSGTGGEPLELVTYLNTTGSTQTVYAAVNQFCAPNAGGGQRIRLATYGYFTSITNLTFETSIFKDAQIYGHAAAAGAVAVGAVDYCEIDTGGTFQTPTTVLDVEPFSSRGGNLRFFFDEDGDPLPGAPEIRVKPEIAAPDGSDTTFFVNDRVAAACGEPNGNPNFFGTSAAAPHAAAVAALLLEARSDLGPALVTDILTATAIDIEGPGDDFLSGAGLIDAYDALDDLPPLCNGRSANIVGTNGGEVLNGTSGPDVIWAGNGNDIINARAGDDVVCAGGGDDLIDGGPGDDIIFGNAGNDTVDYADAPGGVSVNLGQKKATGAAGNDTITAVRNVIGSDHDDTLFGNALANELRGGTGRDIIQGKAGDDALYGEAGPDQLNGRGDDDLLHGGSGIDEATFIQAPTGMTVDLAGAAPQAVGDGSDQLVSIENVRGSNLDDLLEGDGGDNQLLGGNGNDDLRGFAGDDVLKGNKGTDSANGHAGVDLCRTESKVNCEI